jgi:hypothetical protein
MSDLTHNHMNDDSFAKFVAEEVKNRVSSDIREVLFKQENWARWEKALIVLVQNLDNQLERINADIEADTERYTAIDGGEVLLSEALAYYEKQTKKIERFKFHVNTRLIQVSKMIATGARFEDDLAKQVITLKKGIQRHREMLQEFDLEDTAVDRALWDLLEGKWSFDSIDESEIWNDK